jgi:DNA (cytosine-5)-methyltransferase 1
MKIGSLFSGYGGLDLAVSKITGAEVAWHCEWEDAPSKVLEAHFPGVPNYRDVSKVDWEAVEPVDILTGGFPCQDLSLAGKRKGLQDGTRSGLWSEFYKAITIIKPKLVVIENVRGLLSAKADSGMEYGTEVMDKLNGQPALRALGAVLGDLAEIGYDASWQSVRASDAGAAHQRFRVFVVAYPAGGGQSLPTPTVSDQFTANLKSSQQKEGSLHSVSLAQIVHRPDLFPTPTVSDNRGAAKGEIEKSNPKHRLKVEVELLPTTRVSMSNGPTRKEIRNGNPKSRIEVEVMLMPTPTVSQGRNQTSGRKEDSKHHSGTTLQDVAYQGSWGRFEPAIRRWEEVMGRPAPAPTKPDGKDNGHRLSSLFTEWLMGLPEGWITGLGLKRNDELKLAGNGVVPQQAELALRILLEHDNLLERIKK